MRKFSDIIERIELVRTHLGLNKSRFSARIGMKPQTYNNFIGSQGSKPNVELIFGIVNTFGVDPMWLLNGTGAMFLGEGPPPSGAPRGKSYAGASALAYGDVREEGAAFTAGARAENVEQLQDEIRSLEPMLQRVEAQIKRAELHHLPALERVIGMVRRYYEIDPVSAVAELKETLSRMERRIAKVQSASKESP